MTKKHKIIKMLIPIIGIIIILLILIEFKLRKDDESNFNINLKCLHGVCVNEDQMVKCVYFKKKLSDIEFKNDVILVTPTTSICE